MCSLTHWQRTAKGKRSGSSPPGGRGCHFSGLGMNEVAVSPAACFNNQSLTFSFCFQTAPPHPSLHQHGSKMYLFEGLFKTVRENIKSFSHLATADNICHEKKPVERISFILGLRSFILFNANILEHLHKNLRAF